MIQRLTITLVQVKAGHTSENLLKQTHQIIHIFYQAKKLTKNVIDIEMNSVKL